MPFEVIRRSSGCQKAVSLCVCVHVTKDCYPRMSPDRVGQHVSDVIRLLGIPPKYESTEASETTPSNVITL